MQLINAFAFLTLAVSSAYGSAIDTSVVDTALENINLESRSTTCSTTDTTFIRTRVNHFNVFCQMYNAETRSESPFVLLNAKRTTAACKCLLDAWNGKSTTTTAPAASATTCVTADANLIKNEYYYPPAFCTWWNLETRTRSPIPGVSAAEVTKACKCYTAAKASTASTAVKVTSSTKKTTTTSSTKKTTTTSSTKKTTTTSSTKKTSTTSTTTAAACKRRRARRSAAALVPTFTVALATDVPTVA